jgi:hypothetical protein
MPPDSSEDDTTTRSGALDGALSGKTKPNADPSAASRGALTEGDEVKFNARIPENLRDAFQEVCESEGRAMSWVVRQWMLQAVENGETGL